MACLKKVSSQKFHDVDRNQRVNPLAIGCRDMSWKKQPLEHNRCYANFAYLVSCWMLMRNEAQLNGLAHSSVDLSIDVGQFCCFGDWIVNAAFDKVFFLGKSLQNKTTWINVAPEKLIDDARNAEYFLVDRNTVKINEWNSIFHASGDGSNVIAVNEWVLVISSHFSKCSDAMNFAHLWTDAWAMQMV